MFGWVGISAAVILGIVPAATGLYFLTAGRRIPQVPERKKVRYKGVIQFTKGIYTLAIGVILFILASLNIISDIVILLVLVVTISGGYLLFEKWEKKPNTRLDRRK